MKTLLVPVDLSSVTKHVVAAAAVLARALDARLLLLHVNRPVAVVADYTASRERIEEFTALNATAAAKQLAALVNRLARASIRSESLQVTGSPVPVIVDEAKKQRADYIVIGSHGHSAFYDLLLGSTASGILRRAGCPVMVLPPALSQRKQRARRVSKKAAR